MRTLTLVVAAKHMRTGGTMAMAWTQLTMQQQHASGGKAACLLLSRRLVVK
jgi:hypothetical protein